MNKKRILPSVSAVLIIISIILLGNLLYQDYGTCKWQGDTPEDHGIYSCRVYGFAMDYRGDVVNCSSVDTDVTDNLTPICELATRPLSFGAVFGPAILFVLGIGMLILGLKKSRSNTRPETTVK